VAVEVAQAGLQMEDKVALAEELLQVAVVVVQVELVLLQV
jgi:hypothetical protein